MEAHIRIAEAATTVALIDDSLRGAVLRETAREPAALRSQAHAGRVFFIASDDPVSYAMDLLVDEPLPENVAEEYSGRSGVFLLRLPTGRLTATPFERLADGSELPRPAASIEVPPGNYLLTVLDRTIPDMEVHDARLRELLGDADWQYSRRVTSLGALGCLALVIGAALALIPSVRRGAWFLLPLLLLPTLLHLLLARLPRHRRIEARRREYERSLPQYLLVLRPTDIGKDVAGGWYDAR